MEIEDKYFSLLNLLIHDKRTGMNGIICDFRISNYFNGKLFSYNAFMNRQNTSQYIFVEDIEKGNVVFLLPYGIKYMEKEMEEMASKHEKTIRDFFGDKFREDMIMRISEDERQKQIKYFDTLTRGLENWDTLCDIKRDEHEN